MKKRRDVFSIGTRFVALAEATSVVRHRMCYTPQESAFRELSDDTKVKYAFIVWIPTCLCVMTSSQAHARTGDPLMVRGVLFRVLNFDKNNI